MKLKMVLIGLVVSGILFMSCSSDDDDDDHKTYPVNKVVEMAFTKMYPNATGAKWEKKAEYSVVDFRSENLEREAWFDTRGVWYLTETDISFKELPVAVKEAFAGGKFGAWTVDDVDMVQRLGMETVYVLEVKSGKIEFDLYYTLNGVLVKAVEDSDDSDNYLPSALPDAIKTYIATTYPIAKIVDVEIENGIIEVDIIDNLKHRELNFSSTGQWLMTTTEVSKSEVPALVMKALNESIYATYKIDDIYYCNVPANNYYYFELEMGDLEINLKITTDGIIEVDKL